MRSLSARIVTRADGLLTPERLRSYPVILLVLGIGSVLVNAAFGPLPRTLSGLPVAPDYLAHWTGGKLLLQGNAGGLYDAGLQHRLQQQVIGGKPSLSWFVAPPFVAALYVPLALLPYAVSAGVWTLLSTALLAASLVLVRPLLPRLGQQHWGRVVLVVAATQPVLEVLGSGQDSALTLFLWVAGVRLLASGRDRSAGAVLALGLVKPQLFVLVPVVLLVQRRWQALAAWTAVTAGLAGASYGLVGAAGVRTWLGLPYTDLYDRAVQLDQAWKMQGLPSLVTSMAPPGLADAAQVVGLSVALGIVIAFVVVVVRAGQLPVVDLWSFAALTTVLASPHLLGYDLLLAVPAVLFVADKYPHRMTRLALLALFVLTWTSPLRHGLAEHGPWPVTVLGASWSPVPLLVLWELQRRELSARARARVAGIDSGS